jgi:hypothetical protein
MKIPEYSYHPLGCYNHLQVNVVVMRQQPASVLYQLSEKAPGRRIELALVFLLLLPILMYVADKHILSGD